MKVASKASAIVVNNQLLGGTFMLPSTPLSQHLLNYHHSFFNSLSHQSVSSDRVGSAFR